ncbi:MAG: oligosaccharide flippase family protein [Ferruginibacter sp.]
MMLSIKSISANNKILKNFSVLTLSNAFTQFLLIFTSIKIARALDPHVFGTYNLLQLHISIFGVIASLGLRNIIIRSVARDKTIIKKIFLTSLILRSAGFITAIVIFCLYFFLYTNYETLLFILVVQSILATTVFDLLESIAFGLEKMEFSGIINFMSTLCWLATILLIPNSQLSLKLIFSLFVLFNTIKTIVYFFSLYKSDYLKGFLSEKIEKIQVVAFSKECLPYYYLALFTLLSNQIPLLFLEYRSGVEQIGFFNIASKVLMPINLILTTALAAIFPNLSRLFVSNYNQFIRNVKIIFTLIALFSIAGAFGVTLFRKEVIHLMYGDKYKSSGLVLGYQCWYIATYSTVCLIGTILGAINKQKTLSYLSIVCTIIQVPILWFGSKYGAEYLSAAFLVATVITLIIHVFVINNFLKKDLSFIFYLKILAAYVLGYLVSLLTPADLALIYKIMIFLVISLIGGYVIFKKYKNNLKKIFTRQ